jgi:hypothetical protein
MTIAAILHGITSSLSAPSSLRQIGLALGISWATFSWGLPGPNGAQIFAPYVAEKTPVVASTAATSKPIGVGDAADESGNLDLQVSLDALDAPVDAYFGFTAPRIFGDNIMIVLADGGFQPFASGLQPWKTQVTHLNEGVLGEVGLNVLPGDDYTFYLLLSEAGASNPLTGNYYLWSANMALTPGVVQFAEKVLELFPNSIDGLTALFFSFDTGYSLQQIVDATMAGRLGGDGLLVDTLGNLILPENAALGIVQYESNARSSVKEQETESPQVSPEQARERIGAFSTKTAERIKELLEDNDMRLLNDNGFPLHELMQIVLWTDERLDTNDRLYAILGAFAAVREARIAERLSKNRDVNEFLSHSASYTELLDGLPDDPSSKPLERTGSTQGVFRNRAPEALDSSQFAYTNKETVITLYAEDVDGDSLTYSVSRQPEHGVLRGSGEFPRYKPADGFYGVDSLEFSVYDGNAWSASAVVEIEVIDQPLVLDKIILSKYNGLEWDECPDATESSSEICRRTVDSGSGYEWTHTYTLNRSAASFNYYEVHLSSGDVVADYTVSFTFDSPPENITAGESLPILTINGKAEGYIPGHYFNRGFVYYRKIGSSNSYYDERGVYILNSDMPYNEQTARFEGPISASDYTEITVPETAGDGFTLGGKFGWDPGLYIDWIYKAQE